MRTSDITWKQVLHYRIASIYSMLTGDLSNLEIYRQFYFQAVGKTLPTTREELFKVLLDSLEAYEACECKPHPISDLISEGNEASGSEPKLCNIEGGNTCLRHTPTMTCQKVHDS